MRQFVHHENVNLRALKTMYVPVISEMAEMNRGAVGEPDRRGSGNDPAEYLYRMRGRIKVVHFKDYVPGENGEPKFVSLGQGVVDLKACYEAACELGVPFIAYEQDRDWTDGDPFKAAEESWAFLQSL